MEQQSQLQIFENEQFGQVRVIQINNQPWRVLSDVCKILDLSNPTAVANRLDDHKKQKIDPKSNLVSRSNTPITIISESRLYTVILRSDKPNAKAFLRWTTQDVLPSIRKQADTSQTVPSTEDMTKGTFIHVGNLPLIEPQRAVNSPLSATL